MLTNKVESCGKRIKKALSLRGMTQAELCRLSGIPKAPISAYVHDAYEPKEDRARAMARVLDVDPLCLLGYNVPMNADAPSLSDQDLTDGERAWLDLYRTLSPESREVFVPLVSKFDNLPGPVRQMLLASMKAAISSQNKK
jgi:transcriptional regulator with XRE-family HTH domain